MPLTRNQSNAASQARLAAANSSETSTSKEPTDQGGPSAEAEPPRRDSPENCSICLGPFNNKSFTSSCAHSFCFVCLKQWSKVKAECPLCKQPFTSIFHNIRSNQHYDIYELPHQPSNPVDFNSIFNYVGGQIPTFAAPTHHHLFSLSQPAFDADLTLSNFSRFQFRHRRYDRFLNPVSIHGEHPYSFSGPSINPASHTSAAMWPRGAEEFRRDVYRRNLGPPAVILGCENSTYRLTPSMVAASSHRIHRIMPWLTRELRVLLRSHQNVRLAISIIQPLLTQVNIDSMYFHDKITPLIGRRSRQFVQEFVAFANSALNVQNYDRKAMYRRRDIVADVPSSSSSTSSENDVVEVTDISPEVFPNPVAPGPSQTQPLNLSRSGWDSPTLGPWDGANANQDSTVDRVSVSSESDDPVFRPDLRDSDSDKSKVGSDIIFVKYDKPWNERSPINLTSDSEGGEGNDSARKKKKSKHKKKKKEVADNGEASGSKKDRGKKSSKSKHKDKPKSSPKAAVSDDEKVHTEVSKRRHSQSSTEHHKGKKHKKSKSKKEKMSDRELVDKYFAKAMSQEKDDSSGSEDQEVNVPARHKERSLSKEKSKKRKKSRKHSKDSHNQSNRHTYKKHHSGHKKSSNRLADGQQEQQSRHTHSPARQNQVGGPSRSDALGNDNLSQHEPSSSTMSHSVVPGFQPPYLGMADTVQHIPVNLWVSAWPTLSVSHTYPPPPPPIAIGPSIPQSSNTSPSTMTSNPTCTAEPSKTQLDRLSISSDSSSDSSDSESDDAQDLQIPSLQNVHSRTKQWLETNFPDLGRPQTSSTSVSNVGNCNITTSTAMIEQSQNLSERLQNGREAVSKDKEEDIVEVVSIGSEDDDVVVCSSEDSCSNVGDLWVIDVDDSNKKTNKRNNSSSSNTKDNSLGSCHISTFSFSNGNRTAESAAGSSSGPSNIILPPVNKSFQPFKLQKKPAMAICGKDPFFPPMTHSSDEDGEVDNILQSTGHTSKASFAHEAISSQATGLSIVTKSSEISSIDALDVIPSSTIPSVASITNLLDTKDPMNSLPQSTEASIHTNAGLPQDAQMTRLSSITTASFTTATSSMFSVLPPLTSSSHSTKPNISPGISYLPYANLPPSTSVSSILPFTRQSTIPPSPLSLPLSFPKFSQIPLLSTAAQSNNSILPSIYSSQNQMVSATSSILSTEENQGNEYPHLQTSPKKAKGESVVQSHNDSVDGTNCLIGEKVESELQSSSNNTPTQIGIQDDVISSKILDSGAKCDENIIPMEIDDVEASNASYHKTHQYRPVFENDLVSHILKEHKESEANSGDFTFPDDSEKLQAESLDYAAVNVFTPSLPENRSVSADFGGHLNGTLKFASIDSFIPPNSNSLATGIYEKLKSDAQLLPSTNSKYREACALQTNSSLGIDVKPLYSIDSSTADSVLPADSVNDKPFDALDDSVSNDASLSIQPNCVSNPISIETMSNRFEHSLAESTLQSSPIVSQDQSAKPLPVCHPSYNSETSLPVFKPYSDNNDRPLVDQFTDALASSDSDNDK